MLIMFKSIKEDNVLIFDAEYNEGDLIQFAGLLFRKIEKDIFQICKSLNIYVKLEQSKHINRFIEDFTGITDDILNNYGVDLSEAKEIINEFLSCNGNILFVSHGLYNDRQILYDNGIDFYFLNETTPINGLCTYNAAKKLLGRDSKLTLTDIANEVGIFLNHKHNAFDDAWATMGIFSFLCRLKEDKINEEKLF